MTNKLLIVAAVVGLSAGCDFDGSTQGTRSECASPTGPILGCQPEEVHTAAELCWRLVECGSIPLANPADQPGCCFDWKACMNRIDGIDSAQREFVMECVSASSCDDLKTNRSPTRPSTGADDVPLCLQYGDQ